MPYIFYDTETTGIDNRYGQIVQFAAVFTDDDFNIIDRIDVHCRRQAHVVPEPGALLVTGLKPEELDDRRVSNYEMMRDIHHWIKKRSPATIIGYNSNNFDEKYMRQGFYKSLFPLFLTNTGGNEKADLLTIAHSTFIHAPGKIKAEDANKKRSFELTNMCNSNKIKFEEETAHDALADVIATVKLAKLLKKRSPKVWKQMMNNADRGQVEHFVETTPVYCLSECYFNRATSFPVTTLSAHPKNPARYAVFDLTHDPKTYFAMSEEELKAVMTGRKKAGIRNLFANKQPMALPLDFAPTAEKELWPNKKELKKRAQAIAENVEFREKVEKVMGEVFVFDQAPDFIEERIYEGFPDKLEQTRINKFHNADWKGRLRLTDTIKDDRLRKIARRIVYDNAPEVMPVKMRKAMDGWVKKRLHDKQMVPWVNYEAAMDELAKAQHKINKAKEVCKSKKKRVSKDVLQMEKDLKWIYLYYERTFKQEPIGAKPVPAAQTNAFKKRASKANKTLANNHGIGPESLKLELIENDKGKLQPKIIHEEITTPPPATKKLKKKKPVAKKKKKPTPKNKP